MNWQDAEPNPALVVHPPVAVNLDEAHAAIEQWEFYSRKRLDVAQKLAVEHMMAIRTDGTWAARTTGRAESRQNGKGDEIEVVEAWDLTQRGAPVVHTAHEIPTAVSAHQRLVGHLHSHRDLRRRVKQVRSSNSDRSIEMLNNGIVVYRTRTAGGGRGLDDIARVVVDEAQWAQPEQLASTTPILAVNPNPQINFLGSAGVAGRSAQWWELRRRALVGDPGDFAWLEHSAEQVSMVDGRVFSIRPNPADVAAWIVANPAYQSRIAPEFLAEQLRILGPELFAREHLCVWDPPELVTNEHPIDIDAFKHLARDRRKSRDVVPVFFPDIAWGDMKAAAIGVAFISRDGRPHVELAGPKRGQTGTDWLVPRCVELNERYAGATWAVHASGAIGAMIPDLIEAGILLPKERRLGETDMGRACAHLKKLVDGRGFSHSGDVLFYDALYGAAKRDVGDGLWAWGRRKSTTDISPLVAVTGAAWALELFGAYDLLESVY